MSYGPHAKGMHNLIFWEWATRYEHAALLFFRLLVGLALIGDVVGEHFGYASVGRLAPVPAWAQILCGFGIASGTLARWSGLVCGCSFAVAAILIQVHAEFRQAFPVAMVSAFGFYIAARGAGRLALDSIAEHKLFPPKEQKAR